VLFAVGTAITLYLRHRDKETKTLDYEVLSNVEIITSAGERPERLKILFDETEVHNPSITQIRIENTGKQVIEPDDFLSCIQICRENCSIVEWGIVEESADGASGDIGLTVFPGENERIDDTPGTLNPGDWFTVQIVFDGDMNEPLCVTGRMRGEKRPMRLKDPKRRTSRLATVVAGTTTLLGLLVGYIASSLVSNQTARTFGNSISRIAMIVGGAVTAAAIIKIRSVLNSRD
jgi:hypothetical protein